MLKTIDFQLQEEYNSVTFSMTQKVETELSEEELNAIIEKAFKSVIKEITAKPAESVIKDEDALKFDSPPLGSPNTWKVDKDYKPCAKCGDKLDKNGICNICDIPF